MWSRCLSLLLHDLFRRQASLLQTLHVARVREQTEPLVLQLLAQLDQHIQILFAEVESFELPYDHIDVIGQVLNGCHLEDTFLGLLTFGALLAFFL